MRKIVALFFIIILIILFWYLFLKSYQYKINFSAKTTPGTINQTLKMWNRSLKNSTISSENINNLEQQIIINGHDYIFNWEIKLINDSTSNINAYISELDNSFINKITIPFLNTQIEQNSEKHVREFYKINKEHLGNINVDVKGVGEIKGTYCVYVSLKTSQIGKANGMMSYYPLLDSFIAENNIQTNGKPIVEVIHWDMKSDSLQYNFCFPIIKTDSLPIHHALKYKWLENKKVIKAIYNGNYITSDRAWYALIQYAQRNDINIINKPIEIFHHNPNLGKNEKKWRADIYLPIK